MQSDQYLLSRISLGDVKVFEELFNTYYLVLCSYATKIVGDIDQSKDIVQNVFVAVYDKRRTLAINTSVKSYLFRAVHNACLNHLKRISVYDEHHSYLASLQLESDSHNAMIQAELENQIWSEIQKLPEQCQKIFTMNRFEGRKNKEIAETLGISIRTVETQISKALKILRKNLNHLMPTLLLLSTAA